VSEIKIIDTNIIGKQIIDKTLYENCLHSKISNRVLMFDKIYKLLSNGKIKTQGCTRYGSGI